MRYNKRESKVWIWACSIIGVFFIAFTVLLACANLKRKDSHAPTLRSSRRASLAGHPDAAKFYPPVLRSLVINPQSRSNYFDFVLDEGNKSFSRPEEVDPLARKLINYFFLGLTLPSEDFWVNLNPVQPDKIASPRLTATDIGKVLLEVDLNLKKDAARFTDPRIPLGQKYWAKLKQNLKQSGIGHLQKLPLSRLWILPDEAVMEEVGPNRVNIISARLKVCLESEYLNQQNWQVLPAVRQDPEERLIQECAISAMKEVIVPAIEYDVNYSPRYAPLRQVYYSLILAEYFKQKYWGKRGIYDHYINQARLGSLHSRTPWSKKSFFNSYVQSYKKGEYSFYQQEYDPYQVAMAQKHYFSGGFSAGSLGDGFRAVFNNKSQIKSSPISNNQGTADFLGRLWNLDPITEQRDLLALANLTISPSSEPLSSPMMIDERSPSLKYLAALLKLKQIETELNAKVQYIFEETEINNTDEIIKLKNECFILQDQFNILLEEVDQYNLGSSPISVQNAKISLESATFTYTIRNEGAEGANTNGIWNARFKIEKDLSPEDSRLQGQSIWIKENGTDTVEQWTTDHLPLHNYIYTVYVSKNVKSGRIVYAAVWAFEYENEVLGSKIKNYAMQRNVEEYKRLIASEGGTQSSPVETEALLKNLFEKAKLKSGKKELYKLLEIAKNYGGSITPEIKRWFTQMTTAVDDDVRRYAFEAVEAMNNPGNKNIVSVYFFLSTEELFDRAQRKDKDAFNYLVYKITHDPNIMTFEMENWFEDHLTSVDDDIREGAIKALKATQVSSPMRNKIEKMGKELIRIELDFINNLLVVYEMKTGTKMQKESAKLIAYKKRLEKQLDKLENISSSPVEKRDLLALKRGDRVNMLEKLSSPIQNQDIAIGPMSLNEINTALEINKSNLMNAAKESNNDNEIQKFQTERIELLKRRSRLLRSFSSPIAQEQPDMPGTLGGVDLRRITFKVVF